jgi:DNA-directed RNA polymerase subunit RPC12/RpoP
MAAYRCAHCGQTVQRASTKRWIRSLCGTTGRTVHLMRVRWPA